MKIRKQLAGDSFMSHCVYVQLARAGHPTPSNCGFCDGRIEWEHAFLYAGKQINEPWNIIPVCEYHHRGDGLNKRLNEWFALERADMDHLTLMMPRYDWQQRRSYLRGLFGVLSI
jgi:hypothetical protein